MIIPEITSIMWECRPMANIHEAYAQYRNAMPLLFA